MDIDKLKEKVLALVPEAEPEENKQFPTFYIPAAKAHDFMLGLKNDGELSFDFLLCLTGVDMPKFLTVVYHLNSTRHQHALVIKVKTDGRENPVVDTVSDIWRTAEFLEREVYDLLGIRFNNHPDLRRIFLEESWVGYPLRKDYTDEVNIVEL